MSVSGQALYWGFKCEDKMHGLYPQRTSLSLLVFLTMDLVAKCVGKILDKLSL